MLTEQKIHENSFRAYAEAAEAQWARLLEGLPTKTEGQRRVRRNLAVVIENSRRVQETVRGSFMEDGPVRTGNVGYYTKQILPFLRQVFPSLITNEIVSVQPLTGPTGAVLYQEVVRISNKGNTQAGALSPQTLDADYTSEYVPNEVLARGNGVDFGGAGAALNASLAWAPVRPLNASMGYSVVIEEVNATTGVVVQTATDNGTGGFTGAVASGVLNYENGALSNFKFTTAVVNNNIIRVSYTYDMELNSRIPMLKSDIRIAPVMAKSRKLQLQWSREAAQDYAALQGEDLQSSLLAQGGQELALEIDRETITDLFRGSDSTVGVWDRSLPSGVNELDHLRSLVTVTTQVANTIGRKTNRGNANFAIVSPAMQALLEQFTTHSDFRPIYSAGGDGVGYPIDMIRTAGPNGTFAVTRIGTLQSKYVVYVDPYFQDDFILMGLKGPQYLDSGYVWLPYAPLEMVPVFQDPRDGGFRTQYNTRYAKKLTRKEFYGRVRVSNMT